MSDDANRLLVSFSIDRRQLVVTGGKESGLESICRRASGVDAWPAAFSGDD